MADPELMQTRIWLKGLLQEYYSKNIRPAFPKDVNQREFGFGSFTKKIAIRHRAFRDESELLEYMRREAPAHINHSTARYEFADHPEMASKMRRSTDLIFDIDVGDLELGHSHDKGWVCKSCFEALKGEAQKLIEFLTDDFGFAEGELSANFSGSRGYHVRVSNDLVTELDEKSRKEICSYISLEMDLSELIFERGELVFGPKPSQYGLKGRIARTVVENITASDIQNKDWVIKQIEEGNWGAFPKGYGIKRIMNYAKRAAVKIPVDSKVTTDLTHMIRMADTIHGGSMLVAKTVSNLDDFNPMKECFVFDDSEVEVDFIKETPSIDIKDQTFGPYKTGKERLPKYVAAYLCAKSRCNIVKQ
jgi:DNA primase small subunit